MIKESLKIKNGIKLSFLELLKNLLTVSIFFLSMNILLRILMDMQPLLNIFMQMKTQGVTDELTQQFMTNEAYFNKFVLYIIILFIVAILLYLAINALIDLAIANGLKNKKSTIKQYLALLSQYAISFIIILTLIYFALVKMTDISLMTWTITILFAIYIYIWTIASLSISSSWKKSVLSTLKNLIRFKKTLIPLTIILSVTILLIIILTYSIVLFQMWVLIPALLIYAIVSVWAKNYLYKALS